MNRNNVYICGQIISDMEKTHGFYYSFKVAITRNSGIIDEIYVLCPEMIFYNTPVSKGDWVQIEGFLNTDTVERKSAYNKLFTYVRCKRLYKLLNADVCINSVYIEGYLCKKNKVKTTPNGWRLAYIVIAYNRPNKICDYFYSIVWSGNAEKVQEYEIGTKVVIKGRIQSRKYKKDINNEMVEMTAYEVSVSSIYKLNDNQEVK